MNPLHAIYGVIVAACLAYIWHCEVVKKEQIGAAAVAEAARDRALERAGKDRKEKENADAENKRTIDGLRARIAGLRKPVGGGAVSANPAGSRCPDGQVCYDKAEYQRADGAFVAGARGLADEGSEIAVDLDTAQRWAKGRIMANMANPNLVANANYAHLNDWWKKTYADVIAGRDPNYTRKTAGALPTLDAWAAANYRPELRDMTRGRTTFDDHGESQGRTGFVTDYGSHPGSANAEDAYLHTYYNVPSYGTDFLGQWAVPLMMMGMGGLAASHAGAAGAAGGGGGGATAAPPAGGNMFDYSVFDTGAGPIPGSGGPGVTQAGMDWLGSPAVDTFDYGVFDTGAGVTPGSTGPGVTQTGMDWLGKPAVDVGGMGGAGGLSQVLRMLMGGGGAQPGGPQQPGQPGQPGGIPGLAGILSGLYALLNNPRIDPARMNELWSRAMGIQDVAADPRNALYNRTAQQYQDQVRAGQSARGVAMSPYGAGGEADAMRNFNIDWQNQQLARQIAAFQPLSEATGGYYGQSNTDRQFRNTQNQAGANALLTGAAPAFPAIGDWLSTVFTGSGGGGGWPSAADEAFGVPQMG